MKINSIFSSAVQSSSLYDYACGKDTQYINSLTDGLYAAITVFSSTTDTSTTLSSDIALQFGPVQVGSFRFGSVHFR